MPVSDETKAEAPVAVPPTSIEKDVAVAEQSSVSDAEIVRQIKYYFSDANLNLDKFMRTTIEENDGWFDLEVLGKFNRLKQLFPEKSDDEEKKPKSADLAALKDFIKGHLEDVGGLELNDAETAVRRTKPFVKSDEWYQRTVVLKGFPFTAGNDSLVKEVTEILEKDYTVEVIRKRFNAKRKKFNGGLLVQLTTVDQAKALAEKESLEIGEHKVETSLIGDYHDAKQAKGEFISQDLRKPGQEYEEYKPKADKEPECEPVEDSIPHIVVLNDLTESVRLGPLKDSLREIGDFHFIDYRPKEGQAIIKFKEPIAAQVVEKHGSSETPLTVSESKLSVVAGTAEDVEKYIKNTAIRGKRPNKGNSKFNSKRRRH